jgi:uncharacterized protein (DUF1015 family)
MDIKPFKAFRFDESIVGDVGRCTSLPYDVISDAQRESLYERSDYNIVRIIKGKTTPSDSETSNQYTRAAGYLNDWIKKGILKQDPDEAIYFYVQDFSIAGRELRRSGFISLAMLEELGGRVKPHEQTFNGPREDRLRLQLACNANLGLVFMLYKDEKKVADNICEKTLRQKPMMDFMDEQNVRHRLLALTKADDINAVKEMMRDKNCIIADGHHRYQTALDYYRQTQNPAAKYQMFAFVNICNEGLVVLAAHRLVEKIEGFNIERLLSGLEKNFEVISFPFDSPQTRAQAKRKMLARMKTDSDNHKNSFGIYSAGNAFYVAVLKDKLAMDIAASDKSPSWRMLNVSILHKLILEELLGIGENQLAAKSNLEYVKDTDEAVEDIIEKVDSGQKQVAFFINPEKMEQIRIVAEGGEKMPQKSTYFYPKIYTGLTINKL